MSRHSRHSCHYRSTLTGKSDHARDGLRALPGSFVEHLAESAQEFVGGFAAETSAALTLFYTSHAGIPVSTTHTITGAIVGVGSAKRLSAVRWGVAGRVVVAWVLTIPGAAIVAGLTSLIVKALA